MIDYDMLYENMKYIDEYITEKVEWKRNMNSLLRKFNYNPNKSTIKYQGKEYKVNITRDEPTKVRTKSDVAPSQLRTGSTIIDSVIFINPDDFKFNSLKNMETAILHEIGHINVNYDTKTIDPTTIKSNAKNEKDYNYRTGDTFSKYLVYNKSNNLEKDLHYIKLIEKMNRGDTLSKSEIDYLEKKGAINHKLNTAGKGFIERNKFANDTAKLANKNAKNHQYHSNQEEFEADRFAADHLDHGNNRVSHYIDSGYNNEKKELKANITNDTIKAHSEFNNLNNLKDLENTKRKVEDSSWRTVDINGVTYSRKDALNKLDDFIVKAKMNKDTLKESRKVKDSLKDPSSELSKEISKNINKRKSEIANDINSRKKALVSSKYSDTKTFTTLNDKGTNFDKNNKPSNINGKSTQKNMMAIKR